MVPARRAIKVIAYLWLVLATALLAIDILTIVGARPPADGPDVGSFRIAVAVAPWLIAVLATAACLSEIWASPRAHAPVWWLVMILAAYGYWLVAVPVEPVAHWVGGGAVLGIAIAVLVLDILDVFMRRRPGRTAGRSPRAGQVKQDNCDDPEHQSTAPGIDRSGNNGD